MGPLLAVLLAMGAALVPEPDTATSRCAASCAASPAVRAGRSCAARTVRRLPAARPLSRVIDILLPQPCIDRYLALGGQCCCEFKLSLRRAAPKYSPQKHVCAARDSALFSVLCHHQIYISLFTE